MRSRNENRYDLLFIAVMFFAAAFALASTSCGPNATQQRLNTAESALHRAENLFVDWDGEHQVRLVELADPGTEEQVLERYRRKRDDIVAAFVEAWTALELAATDPRPSNFEALIVKSKTLFKMVEELRR